MKRFFLIIAALLIVAGASAQNKWGIMAGANFSTLKFPDNSSLEDMYKTKTGFRMGLTYDMKLIGGLGLNTGLFYSFRQTELDNAGNTTEYKYNSLELPANLTLRLPVPVVHPFIIAGPYLDCGLGAKAGDEKLDYGDNLNRFNYGITLGGGVDVFKSIRVMYQYDWGLSDLQTSVGSALDTDGKSRGHRISVGVMF